MLKKTARLTQGKHITSVLQQGRLYRCSLFLLRCNLQMVETVPLNTVFYWNEPQQKQIYFKFAFVLSKKLSKHAVVRNLLRRRFREVVRLWLLSLNPVSTLSLPPNSLKQQVALVFIPSRNALELPLETLQTEMHDVLYSFLNN